MPSRWVGNLYGAAAAGVVLVSLLVVAARWSSSAYAWSDSFEYLTGGLSLFSGQGFKGTDGHAQAFYPPFYPLLIGLAHLVLRDPEIAGRIVSVAASTLALILFAFVARKWFSPRVALCAVAMLGFLPLRIWTASWIMSDSLFLLLALVAVATYFVSAWNSVLRGVLTGIVLGFAYLTRPEAIVYLFAIGALELVFGIRDRSRERLVAISFLAVAFVLTALPYVVYLRGVTGQWSVSGKTSYVWSYSAFSSDPETRFRTVLQLNEEGTALAPEPARAVALGDLARHYGGNLRKEWDLLLYQLGPSWLTFTLLLLGLTGAVAQARSGKSTDRLLAQLVLVSPLALYPAWHVLDRFLLPAIPVFCLWAAKGLGELYSWTPIRSQSANVSGRAGGWTRTEDRPVGGKRVLRGVAVVLGLILFASFGFRLSTTSSNLDDFRAQKGLAAWMRAENLERGRIVAQFPGVPFFAGMDWESLPLDTFPRTVAYARHQGARYIVVSTWDKPIPTANALLSGEGSRQAVQEVYRVAVPSGEIGLFELRPTPGG